MPAERKEGPALAPDRFAVKTLWVPKKLSYNQRGRLSANIFKSVAVQRTAFSGVCQGKSYWQNTTWPGSVKTGFKKSHATK